MFDQFLSTVIAGCVIAGFVQGLSGFAFSLVALSIWSWSVSPQLAVPMAVFGSLVGQLVTLPLTWRGMNFQRTWPFVLGGVFGVPLGSLMLPHLNAELFRVSLGLFLVIYCPTMLVLSQSFRITRGGRWADGASGLIGGLMGGVAGIAGPAPTVWTTLRGWEKAEQRGVVQGFNIAMLATTLATYLFSSKLSGLSGVFAVMAPAIVLPAVLGAVVFNRMSSASFRKVVLMLLMASGLALLASAVSGV